jgi:hypothetical protein
MLPVVTLLGYSRPMIRADHYHRPVALAAAGPDPLAGGWLYESVTAFGAE